MRRETLCILSAALAVSLSACAGVGDGKGEGSGSITTTAAVEPVEAKVNKSELSHEKHGYGQGVQFDSENRPQGALDLNAACGKLGAKAINEDTDKITLTFDQGYENGFTMQILDTLKEKNVKATFFLVQDYAERNPEIVKRMIEDGHTVANHSVHHYSMPDLDEEQCRSEIMDFHEYMKSNFGVEMTEFRPPMGEYSDFSLAVTKDCGYETVLWSFAYADWDVNAQPDPKAALEKLTNAAHPGAIYLLHSVSQTNANVMGDMIDAIRARGFEFE
ncbi:MAG: polysaccharide deacetylase family protein [Ruminococcus sp.]|nr:polysaccharide deacetylase family protein [Ruminococcus sp.]